MDEVNKDVKDSQDLKDNKPATLIPADPAKCVRERIAAQDARKEANRPGSSKPAPGAI
jgi:hypothetical protein